MLKATVMMLMNKIPTFMTKIMWSAEKAPDGATTACAGHSATASVNDSSRPISWCFLNYVVSLMVEWTKTQISFHELVGLISSNTHLAVAGTSRWNWLFEDCSTLFLFSRYFLIGHVSHKIHTWAEQTCWTKDAYPMRGRTDEILHHGPHQLKSAQDFWQVGMCWIRMDTLGACSTSTTELLGTAGCNKSHAPLCAMCPSPAMCISMQSNKGDIPPMSTPNCGGGFAAWSHCWQKSSLILQ
jgi:hypothetical protein